MIMMMIMIMTMTMTTFTNISYFEFVIQLIISNRWWHTTPEFALIYERVTRTFLFCKKLLPRSFWNFARSIAVFLVNGVFDSCDSGGKQCNGNVFIYKWITRMRMLFPLTKYQRNTHHNIICRSRFRKQWLVKLRNIILIYLGSNKFL